jgi:hypothetical protein
MKKKLRKSSAIDILDDAVDELLKSASDMDEEEIDEDFLYDEEDDDIDYSKKKKKAMKEDEEEEEEDEEDEDFEDDDEDEDRELSETFHEDDLEWDDDDDEYATGKARKLDKEYGGKKPLNAKLMNEAEYSAYYRKMMAAPTGKKPSVRVTTKSFTSNMDDDAQRAIEISPFLRNITKSMNGRVNDLGEIVAENIQRQESFNRSLAKAVGMIARGLSEPNAPKSRRAGYQVLNKSYDKSDMPSVKVIQGVLEKSAREGEIDPTALTMFEMTHQITPEVQYLLESKNLI